VFSKWAQGAGNATLSNKQPQKRVMNILFQYTRLLIGWATNELQATSFGGYWNTYPINDTILQSLSGKYLVQTSLKPTSLSIDMLSAST